MAITSIRWTPLQARPFQRELTVGQFNYYHALFVLLNINLYLSFYMNIEVKTALPHSTKPMIKTWRHLQAPEKMFSCFTQSD